MTEPTLHESHNWSAPVSFLTDAPAGSQVCTACDICTCHYQAEATAPCPETKRTPVPATVTNPTARLSCNMNAETAAVMAVRHDTEGVSYTEQVRRGIAVYDYLATETTAGATIQLHYPDGRANEVHLIR